MNKKVMSGAIIVIVSIITMAVIGGIYYKLNIVEKPFKFSDEDITIEVKEGETLNNLLNKLHIQNLINNEKLIKLYVRLNNVDTDIKVGTYVVKKNVQLQEFLNMLTEGEKQQEDIKVTFPEGFDIEKMAKRLEENKIISADEFIKGVKEYELPLYIKNVEGRKYPLEGYLFPDTYFFREGATAKEIIDIMIQNFEQVFEEIKKETKKDIVDNDIDKIIILASVIEKEAEQDTERARVASVFYNRLDIDMKLQSCATVLYALGEHREELYNKDLEVKSPYNTYLMEGLPLGPICSPSKASIEAAVNPEETEYLFFISNDDRTHNFTTSYDEFLKYKDEREERIKE